MTTIDDVLPTTKELQKKLAVAEAEKGAEAARRAAAEDAEKKALLEGLSKPTGVADEEHVRRAAAIIDRAAERKAVAREALHRVGLTEAIDKRPDELSGGMRQRVAVARALAMRPKVLLMDEPFAALDVQTRARMQDFLLDVWRDSGASVLFVTPHIDEAVALADRVVVFTSRPGRIKTVFPIALPRPRNLFSREIEAIRIQLTELLRDEVDRAFAEQEALTATA